MIAVELASASKRYGRRVALDGVDLVVPAGAAVGLLGPNGAGKTTLLRLLLGLVRPSRGAARLRGRDPLDPAAREGVGYLPERLRLPADLPLRRFLGLHAALAGLGAAARAREVDAALDGAGLREYAEEPLGALSAGLARRAGFAQALLGSPELLLLDEPTAGLDPLGVRDAREWIAGARARSATVLMGSHVLSEVERVCDRVVILVRGRIATSGPFERVLRSGESLEDAFVRVVAG